MPNGGVPVNMALFPTDSAEVVLYCHGGVLQIFRAADWNVTKAESQPLCTLTPKEGAALAWFLGYWLGEEQLKPAYRMRDDVNAVFHP